MQSSGNLVNFQQFIISSLVSLGGMYILARGIRRAGRDGGNNFADEIKKAGVAYAASVKEAGVSIADCIKEVGVALAGSVKETGVIHAESVKEAGKSLGTSLFWSSARLACALVLMFWLALFCSCSQLASLKSSLEGRALKSLAQEHNY